MYYPDLETRAKKNLLPGVYARTFWGDKLMLAVVNLEADAVIPEHSHPHEQGGIVLEGELEFNIAGEIRMLHSGDIYIIPGDVVHSVKVGPAAARVMDIFVPVREEYK
ncbi:MAG: cupin domain-containing protein [Anaerolineales bacterium]|nr:cupin domain-containing protein [Anaerolineales bacterium]